MFSKKHLPKNESKPIRVPRNVRDTIPVHQLYEDGIFRTGSSYSKTYQFSDINYLVASESDKESMFLRYSDLLRSIDSSASAKITISNHYLSRANFEKSVLMPLQDDGLDLYREEYNEMLLSRSTGASGLSQEKFLTLSVTKRSIEEARAFFARAGSELASHYQSLGSRLQALSCVERLRILHDFYRPGEENFFHFDFKERQHLGLDFRDYIGPDSIEHFRDHLRIGDTYARVLFLKDYASYLKDDILTVLTSLEGRMMLSVDLLPQPGDESIREVERRLLGIETNITAWQQRQNRNSNYSATVPYDLAQQKNALKELLDDLTTRDQRLLHCTITCVITAQSMEELDRVTESVRSFAASRSCQLAPLTWEQIEGLQTVLPLGLNRIHAWRTLTTESLATFIPFKVQEIMDRKGIYYGENAISHNLIMCNKENLMNQSSFILGVPGSGKSFATKQLLTFLILNTTDDILIFDPEGEYAPLVNAMGDLGNVVHISAGGHDRLNAMHLEEGDDTLDPVIVKSQFIMSLLEQIDHGGIGSHEKSIIDRCTASVYEDCRQNGQTPTLTLLREKLLAQVESEAKRIALALELYTTGSLDIFGHESNVSLDKRVIVFDTHGLGEDLKPAGLLVITDAMLNRVFYNWRHGKRTHIVIDEFHVAFENEFSAAFFTSAWRQFRKRNAYPIGITQNCEYLLSSIGARTMLSNSEFIVMLNQAASDREKLASLLNISREQLSYITDAEPGCGLIKYGSALVPFVNHFPTNTRLYQLMTTRPGEGVFSSSAHSS